jgi:hypothetical protein
MKKTGTKAQHAKHAKLMAAKDRAVMSIYATAPNNLTPFNDCYDHAPTELRKAYHIASQELNDFEASMVQDGRGWMRGYVFYWY